jgi:(2Fe-2S) ferredoxin
MRTHQGQPDALLDAAGPNVSVRVTGCVGLCSASNLVIVGRPGGTRLWLAGVLTEEATATLAAWIRSGGDDPVPERLRPHVVGRTLKVA